MMRAMQNQPSSFDNVSRHGERALLKGVLVYAVLFVIWLALSLVVGLLLRLPASQVLVVAAALALATEVVLHRLR
jgi:hypothetical protein